MTLYTGAGLTFAFLMLIFQAGGFVWLAKNHMAHAQESLDRLEERLTRVEVLLGRVCGRLDIKP